MKSKLAIIVSWGWMKCAWEVGVMLCLAEKYHIIHPDILIAASGSSGTWSYYVAQQYTSMRNIRSNLLSVKELLDPWRFREIINVDYLIDDVFQKQDLLDESKVRTASTHYLIPALHAKTGQIHYFSNKGHVNIFEAMRASMAIPIAFKINPHVIIDGQPYCDSMATTHPNSHIAKAVELGATKILVIDVLKKKQSGLLHYLFSLWVLCHSWLFKKNYFKLSRQIHRYQVPEWIDVFVLRRKRRSAVITMLDNNKTHLIKSMDCWYHETIENKSLAKFLAT